MTKSGQAFNAWRTADLAAREAEHALQETWNGYALGKGAPPSREVIANVARLRATAHEKLTAAIAVVDTEAEATRQLLKSAPRDERPSSH